MREQGGRELAEPKFDQKGEHDRLELDGALPKLFDARGAIDVAECIVNFLFGRRFAENVFGAEPAFFPEALLEGEQDARDLRLVAVVLLVE